MPKKKQKPVLYENVLADLASWFDASAVRGILIGGVAASLLGKPRFTQDVDALVWMPSNKWKAFFEEGLRHGFKPRIADPLRFAQQSRVLLMKHSQTKLGIDISFGALPFEEESIKRRRKVRVGSITVYLPTPEDLIIMKAVAHRRQDLLDIETLLTVHPTVDKKRILKWVTEFSHILEKPEILKDLKNLLS